MCTLVAPSAPRESSRSERGAGVSKYPAPLGPEALMTVVLCQNHTRTAAVVDLSSAYRFLNGLCFALNIGLAQKWRPWLLPPGMLPVRASLRSRGQLQEVSQLQWRTAIQPDPDRGNGSTSRCHYRSYTHSLVLSDAASLTQHARDLRDRVRM